MAKKTLSLSRKIFDAREKLAAFVSDLNSNFTELFNYSDSDPSFKRVGSVIKKVNDGDTMVFGTDTNNLTLSADGSLRLNGTATVFEDLFVPLTSSKVGANAKPDFDETNIGYLFPQNDATEILYLIVQIPHRYKEGSDIYPHIHYKRTAAGKPTFKIAYTWFNTGSATAAPTTVLPLDVEATTYTSGSIHQINKSATAISGTGKTISSLLLIKLYREDNTVTGDVLAYQFDLHFEVDGIGSSTEYTK